MEDSRKACYMGELLTDAEMHTATSEDIASILKMCKDLPYLQEPLWRFLSTCEKSGIFAKAPVGSLRAQVVARCVWYLGRLHKINGNAAFCIAHASAGVLQQLSGHIVRALESRALETELRAKLIYGLGVLRFREPSVIKAVVRHVESPSQLKGISPMSVSCVVYGMQHLDITDFYSLQPLTDVILHDIGLGRFSNLDIASLLTSAVKMRWKNDDLDLKLAKEACRWARLQKYNPKTFSTVCLSLGRLNYQDQQDIARVVNYVKKLDRLQTLDTQGLSHVAFGMHLLKVTDSEMWTMMGAQAQRPSRLKWFTEQGLAMLIHSLGWHVDQPSVWNTLSEEVLEKRDLSCFTEQSLMTMLSGLHSQPSSKERLLKAILMELADVRLWNLSEANLIEAFGALCALNLEDADFIKLARQAVFTEIQNRAYQDLLSAQSIALIVFALGRVKSCQLESHQTLFQFLVHVLDPFVITELTPQGFACVLFGLGELRFKHGKILDALASAVLRTGLSKFSTFELCNVFFGLGKCGYRRSRQLGIILGELLKEQRFQEMNSGIVSTLMLSLPYHQFEDKELMELLFDRFLDSHLLPTFSLRQLSVVLYASVLVNYKDDKRIARLLQTLFMERSQPWTAEEKKQLPWLMHSLGLLKHKDQQIWNFIFAELDRDNYELLTQLDVQQLTSVLVALRQANNCPSALIQHLLDHLLKSNSLFQMDISSRIKVLECVVAITPNDTASVERLVKKLFVRMRTKQLSQAAMLRIADCLFQTHFIANCNLSKWFLTEMLTFEGGILFSRLPDRQLLYLVFALPILIDQQHPYVSLLLDVLIAEVLSIRRRESIRMMDMIKAISALKKAEKQFKQMEPFDVLPLIVR